MGQTCNPSAFTASQGKLLLRLARETLLAHFKKTSIQVIKEIAKDNAFQCRQGTFVTLEKNGHLRGCIGTLSGRDSVAQGVQDNARSAAFHDFRFPGLTVDELNQIVIEVSILTDPQPLSFKNANDLLDQLRPGIDGVILRQGNAQATFLPQVWDQLPDPKDFLSHLCRKAGLAGDAWRRERIEIRTYQVQHFKEASPGEDASTGLFHPHESSSKGKDE